MGVIALIYKIWRTCYTPVIPGEPPIVRHIIPFFGHFWGLMRHAHEYVNKLCQNTSHPIFTIPVLHGKAYVVSSPSFAQAVFRNKALSFAPFVVEFVHRMEDLSAPAKRAYAEGLHTQVMQLFAARMNGSARKKMAAVALQELARLLPHHRLSEGDIAGSPSNSPVQDLWLWLRTIMTVSTTSSLLGTTNNPWIKDHSLVESYWKFEAGDPTGRTSLIDVTYRNSKKSHDTMVDALEAYFAAECDVSSVDSSDSFVAPLTVDTAAIQRKYGFSAREIAATYVTIVHGALVNMVPTLFWCVAYIFSRPSLLAQLREELISALVSENGQRPEEDGKPRIVVMDADKIESCCPLMLSAFRETQRLVAIGTLHRRVVEDTTVSHNGGEGQELSYLLKKGTSILLPVASTHRNPLIWGPTANEFEATRFLGSQSQTREAAMTPDNQEKLEDEESTFARLRKTAYFPFGGGRELCPGRHFATTEVLGTMAVLVLGYDIRTIDGGPLKQPRFAPSRMTAATARPHPEADLKVQIGRRDGWKEVVWKIKDFP
ncbi:hypothetical protein CNMCM6106_004652 [Aspergillus hiratsukae]|uniref:Cytochrome P450 n=1 Tax=Aspergillus hiratsukae TaxID=1194566 RepID=A0A8H6PIU4_9EURO|nr:hypothetical protein CNMCM6106_004652 [Aspergillus hiratsukae]